MQNNLHARLTKALNQYFRICTGSDRVAGVSYDTVAKIRYRSDLIWNIEIDKQIFVGIRVKVPLTKLRMHISIHSVEEVVRLV